MKNKNDCCSHSLAEARREIDEKWRERVEKKAEKRLWTNTVANNMHVVKKYHQGINDLVSDLLTGDNQLSKHDQELIREGRAMSDFDTRRGE